MVEAIKGKMELSRPNLKQRKIINHHRFSYVTSLRHVTFMQWEI